MRKREIKREKAREGKEGRGYIKNEWHAEK